MKNIISNLKNTLLIGAYKFLDGFEKILNNGVRTITVIKVEFFDTSKITLENNSK